MAFCSSRILITLFALGTAILSAKKPNIVLIMADDLGLGDVGYHTKTHLNKEPIVPTPRMDELAENSLWFTDGHSSTALCSPTRYCVMTGNLNHRSSAPWGVWGTFRESPIKMGESTLGTVTKSAGYSTGFIGKWHLGGDYYKKGTTEIFRDFKRGERDYTVDVSKIIGGGPQSFGFEYSFTMPCGVQGPVYLAYENGVWYPFHDDSKIIFLDKESAIDPQFVSDKGPGPGDSHWNTPAVGKMIADKAANFINKQSSDKPFFLCYWSPTVHLPHTPPEKFNGRKIANQTPTHHLDMVLDFDQQIGTIVDALKRKGALDNTMIIVTSDNGGLSDKKGSQAGHDSNGGYRGNKNAPHEGGHRVPYFIHWPEKISAGIKNPTPVTTHDVLATLAAIVGTEIPKGHALDSMNLNPIIQREEAPVREHFLLQGGSKKELIYRHGPWKLIIQSNHKADKFDPVALFNLEDNVQEKEGENLISHPDQKTRIDTMLAKYLEIRNKGLPTAPGRR